MTTNSDAKNKNDWSQDDDDDTWDDWGDAEDDDQPPSPPTTSSSPAKTSTTATTTIGENYNNNRNDATPLQHTVDGKSFWGSSIWGAVISTATDLTSTVSQGLNQVIGVTEPEQLARMNAEEHHNAMGVEYNNDTAPTAPPVFGSTLVSGVTTLGTKVFNTGLDTLEGIGKKTMDILQENDPLLMNKRKLLRLEADRPNLSEILKEAKKDADDLENTLKELKIEKTREQLRFEVIFENKCGLVHLEALEILSRESTLKLQSLLDSVSGTALRDLQETVNEVKELLELEELEAESDGAYDAQQLNAQLLAAVEDADLPIDFADIVSNWTQSLEWLTTVTPSTADAAQPTTVDDEQQQAFAKSITALAETCALEMCKLHKMAELLLIKEHHSTANEVDCLVQLCKLFCAHLNGLTNRYAATLTGGRCGQSEETKCKEVSTLFAEMLTATQQIEKAFQLFVPILQITAV